MTESRGSKHAIVCDNCKKVFYFEKAYEEHLENE
jgi:Fe2+ or Zn2+ uptake regulation protein